MQPDPTLRMRAGCQPRNGAAITPRTCAGCAAHDLNFCRALRGSGLMPEPVNRSERSVTARHNICRAGESSEGVLVVCDGWAVRYVQLSNGKRQILSVILPGELISAAHMLERSLSFLVQAVTNVRYCHFGTEDVRIRMRSDPALFDDWGRLVAAEHRSADRLLVDLGQRSARERIAALVLQIMLRYEERNGTGVDAFPLPLSQQQIADFTGLTPVHACRVLNALRRNGVCDIGQGRARIFDRAELQRFATSK
jgi:CRP-like cAMP-binding protein